MIRNASTTGQVNFSAETGYTSTLGGRDWSVIFTLYRDDAMSGGTTFNNVCRCTNTVAPNGETLRVRYNDSLEEFEVRVQDSTSPRAATAAMNEGGTAQAGGASTITLATTEQAVDDAYNGWTISITGGTGNGQSKTVTDYVGSTKVATVDSAWATPPDATSVYAMVVDAGHTLETWGLLGISWTNATKQLNCWFQPRGGTKIPFFATGAAAFSGVPNPSTFSLFGNGAGADENYRGTSACAMALGVLTSANFDTIYTAFNTNGPAGAFVAFNAINAATWHSGFLHTSGGVATIGNAVTTTNVEGRLVAGGTQLGLHSVSSTVGTLTIVAPDDIPPIGGWVRELPGSAVDQNLIGLAIPVLKDMGAQVTPTGVKRILITGNSRSVGHNDGDNGDGALSAGIEYHLVQNVLLAGAGWGNNAAGSPRRVWGHPTLEAAVTGTVEDVSTNSATYADWSRVGSGGARTGSLAIANSGTAQAGGASTITLAVGASATDDIYNGFTVQITSGTGSGQERTISDYVGATKVATVSSAWTTPPNATSVYEVNFAYKDRGPGNGRYIVSTGTYAPAAFSDAATLGLIDPAAALTFRAYYLKWPGAGTLRWQTAKGAAVNNLATLGSTTDIDCDTETDTYTYNTGTDTYNATTRTLVITSGVLYEVGDLIHNATRTSIAQIESITNGGSTKTIVLKQGFKTAPSNTDVFSIGPYQIGVIDGSHIADANVWRGMKFTAVTGDVCVLSIDAWITNANGYFIAAIGWGGNGYDLQLVSSWNSATTRLIAAINPNAVIQMYVTQDLDGSHVDDYRAEIEAGKPGVGVFQFGEGCHATSATTLINQTNITARDNVLAAAPSETVAAQDFLEWPTGGTYTYQVVNGEREDTAHYSARGSAKWAGILFDALALLPSNTLDDSLTYRHGLYTALHAART